MAHFAKIEDGIVTQVNVIDEEYFAANKETRYTGQWVQTSYNTQGGVHLLGGTPLRKNYAGVGFTYDEGRDAFIPPKPFESWLLDEDTCNWNAPIPMPTDGGSYEWNEEVGDWVAIDEEV
jgi:hypothetical protein